MSVNKDVPGVRSVSAEVIVPGTPEEVWQAIATGQGVSSWFVPTEKRDDGTVVSHFGPGMDVIAKETAYDPPHRFAAESPMGIGPDAKKMATEWIVEARAGGTCLVRVVHSLFATTDDWDDHLESIESGWPDYFRILKAYLQYFRGLPCTGIQLLAITAPPAVEAWARIAVPLGLVDAAVGERRTASGEIPPLSGNVEMAGERGHPNQVLLRTDSPAPGLVHLFASDMGGQAVISIRFYLYGDQAPAAVQRDEPQWQAWINGLFPTPAGSALDC